MSLSPYCQVRTVLRSIRLVLAVALLGGASAARAAPPSPNDTQPPASPPTPQQPGTHSPGPVLPAGHPKLPTRHGELPAGHPKLPPGHPQVRPSKKPPTLRTDGNALPLRLKGPGSAAELRRALASLGEDSSAKADFEQAFRLTFTVDRNKRDPVAAMALLKSLLDKHPRHAATHRTMGYVHIQLSFDLDAALKSYEEAVAIDPNYGEAHYALAFLYAIRDRKIGAEHFRRALELGIEDVNGLGPRFYPDVKVGPPPRPE